MYAIVDIETSGGRALDKITEIAIYVFDGTKITDQFVSLINPEVRISPFITNLTGITNEMVEHAPKFYEIAKRIIEITANKIFVAHNVAFDYNFVKAEFKRLGYDYRRKTLCTVKLSRKIIPGLPSYSLGNLCQSLRIPIKDRHRAAGDAFATVKLFDLLLQRNVHQNDLFVPAERVALNNLHPFLNKEKIENLPQKTGVYYFYDEDKDLIYIGKSKNIYERVLNHFSNQKTKHAIRMRESIADISFEITGSELIALLLESSEIKLNKPLYNRAQRRSVNTWGIYEEMDNKGYMNLLVQKNSNLDVPFVSFDTQENAKSFLFTLVKKHKLCQKLCGLYESKGACFQYTLHVCNGACIEEEMPVNYNKRVDEAITEMGLGPVSRFIIDKGRHEDERSVVKIVSGKYIGFGYIDVSEGIQSKEALNECIEKQQDNRDVQKIIKNFLKNNKVEKIITCD